MALNHATRPVVQEPVCEGSRASARIALTVNVDWGEEYLPLILETCAAKNVRLTFFITGRWAEKFPDMVRRISAAGHEVGSHGYAHPHPDHLSVDGNLHDIRRAEDVLTRILGVRPRLYAPPYGERGPAVLQAAESAGYRTVLWSVDSVDWRHRDRAYIVRRVTGRAHNGAIVLMHPTEATAAAMPELIESLKDKGYELVTVSELIAD
ncbi:MAG: polysaccharide deacetylase family protein [Bacillota bacterium]|nr:polysaccharide deacetylase family protein [Bacillota bacterium]